MTGGSGSGKSTLCNYLNKNYHVPIYYVDVEANGILNRSVEVQKKVIEEFGELSYSEGKFDKAYMRNIVFSDADKLTKLNEIVFPEVESDVSKWFRAMELNGQHYAVMENAILFESLGRGMFDRVIMVTAPLYMRVERIRSRDGITEEQAKKRIAMQLPDELKIKFSDFVLSTRRQGDAEYNIQEIHRDLLNNHTRDGWS